MDKINDFIKEIEAGLATIKIDPKQMWVPVLAASLHNKVFIDHIFNELYDRQVRKRNHIRKRLNNESSQLFISILRELSDRPLQPPA